ncbi:hypothetical protein [uncultured Herbaspirillum sp.]|jgi:hypothetical protein|uniref:hypothetical protein n=1 Tax=uncultured Herbaspirillum sp. TaxID=160236 RepID=UPI00258F2C83|nr:hypothetical protein [uncultured Herbaspirillum sp.]
MKLSSAHCPASGRGVGKGIILAERAPPAHKNRLKNIEKKQVFLQRPMLDKLTIASAL